MVQRYINKQIEKLALPAEFIHTVEHWYNPIAKEIAEMYTGQGTPLVIGVQGVQGSGKSTLADFLEILLRHAFGLRVTVLSIDDFYLTRRERLALAESVHPLLITRGVPGTHDVNLARAVIDKLKQLPAGETIAVPRFNKALDDREPSFNWSRVCGPVDVIIFEGWCVGASAQDDASLDVPINLLEREEDREGIWRRYVNEQLKQQYADLFSTLDALVVLAAPTFECVYGWRLLQEQKLEEQWRKENSDLPSNIQTPEQLKRFIAHYERISRQCLATLPGQADWLLTLNEDHDIVQLCRKPGFLIFTDLDGTLLDHKTYSFAAAAPAIDACRKKRIPIIINSSKTRDEILLIRESLNVKDSFIVENGSAVYLPKAVFGACPDGALEEGEYWKKTLGKDRPFIIEMLQTLRSQHGWRFEGFYDWNVEQVITLTDLDSTQAKAALKRQFSEPLLWQDSEENFSRFAAQLAEYQLKTLRGGRFIHVIGDCGKGSAMQWLAGQYQTLMGRKPKLIALGDSPNDIDMLSIADYPVVVKSPAPSLSEFYARAKTMKTSLCGPEGWNNAVLDIINSHHADEAN